VKIAGMCLVGAIALSSGFAMGHGLHVDAREIAVALTATPETAEAYRDEMRKLRLESEKQHRQSKHHEVETPAQQAATRSIK
jgi:hypothetical protein